MAKLSRKLVIVLNDEAEDSLLATYAVERVNHARDFVQLAKCVMKRSLLEWEKESFRVGPIIIGASGGVMGCPK
ncbi:hypothetical protein AN963_09990 [Brevibacillus choshinensis]|uniref:Uncharacterized protein n=1 Tax=Brevibacillus choshinensis TaxID=54911 RepID=A0ABR5NEK1_BRECH|nr:hypothetical protein AN963_09990 [Brevibacillus choshinensis]